MINSTGNETNCTYVFPTDNSSDVIRVCEEGDNTDEGTPLSQITTIIITGILGLSGIFMNIGILTIIIQRKLIKKDYRMLYYMFMTIGDLLFATNCAFVGINIAFKSAYAFRLHSVCLTLNIVMGLVAYQWTAICIILLIIDLVWTIKHPFSDHRNLRKFSKIGCVGTFIVAILLGVGPFMLWDDIPYVLSFCSLTNVYGDHAEFFYIESVAVLAILLSTMIIVSGILIYQIYKSHTVIDEGSQKRSTVTQCDISVVETSVPEIEHGNKNGHMNGGYVTDISDVTINNDNSVTPRGQQDDLRKYSEDTSTYTDPVSVSRREIRRKEFLRSCRTVGIFMLAYIGSATPYTILNATKIYFGCVGTCTDSQDTRMIRAAVSITLYLLPVIDPVLYTQRFDVFKQAYLGVFKQCCKRGVNSNTLVENY